MAKQADSEENKPWMIRDMPLWVRNAVKSYAAEHDMTIAEALEYIVERQLGDERTQRVKALVRHKLELAEQGMKLAEQEEGE